VSDSKPQSSRRSQRISDEQVSLIRTKQKNALLCIDDISVSFDGFKALTNLTMVLDAGELRCIIGPHGAGKTNLMDVVTGKTVPDKGSVFFLEEVEDLTC